ncbi:MAG TPA: hypothetical protein VFK38_10730 [Candidatus Limnocylindrales bacterium]|nr:hypothetical protein [Candidatus Limnocylindrales bacterium]
MDPLPALLGMLGAAGALSALAAPAVVRRLGRDRTSTTLTRDPGRPDGSRPRRRSERVGEVDDPLLAAMLEHGPEARR